MGKSARPLGLFIAAMLSIVTSIEISAQQANGSTTVWIPLESFADANNNRHISDIRTLDVRVEIESEQFARIYYTTNGWQQKVANDEPHQVHPGWLRCVDVLTPLPDLNSLFVSDSSWAGSAGSDWHLRPPVSNWNQVLDDGQVPGPSGYNPPHAKGGSLVGLISHNGFLFATISLRPNRDIDNSNPNAVPPIPPTPGLDQPKFTQFNGLSFLYGVEDPLLSFDPANGVGKELWSGGFGGFDRELGPPVVDNGLRYAVPEGVDIVVNQPTNQPVSRFLFVANYCGFFLGGHVLVQDISSLQGVRPIRRLQVPLYELLGDYLEGLATNPPVVEKLGPEVSRERFTCPSSTIITEIPDCEPFEDPPGPGEDPTIGFEDNVGGNKIRSVIVVEAAKTWPFLPEGTKGRKFLMAGMNLDPFHIDAYNAPLDPQPDPSDKPLDPADPADAVWVHGRDDGKYDYVAIVDVTELISPPTTGPDLIGSDLWSFLDLWQWEDRVRFLRLPPDLPPTWSLGDDPLLNEPGHDWSEVTVYKPGDFNVSTQVRIVGSGTPKTLAAGPEGRFVYVVTSDQGQENVDEFSTLHDGGLHVPHLYVIDLSQGDFSDQGFLDNYTNSTDFKSYRLPKIATAAFDDGMGGEIIGSTLINSTIPGFPTTSFPSPYTVAGHAVGPTIQSGATAAQVGPYYPGEWQADPTARARLIAIRNESFNHHQNRLYLGCTLRAQTSAGDYKAGEYVSGIHVFSLDHPSQDKGQPYYLRTLVLPQVVVSEPFTVAGMDALPNDADWISGGGNSPARNVLVVSGRSGQSVVFPDNPTDRVYFIQDDYDQP